MELCKGCLFYNEQLSDFVAMYQDSTPETEKAKEHFCPMFMSGIPDGIWADTDPCEYRCNLKGDPEPMPEG